MKVTEIIEVFDDEGNKINSIPKTVEGLTKLYFTFLATMSSNEVDIHSKVLNILMNKMLFERVDLEYLKSYPNIFQFYTMVERYYNDYYLKHNKIVKSVRLLTDSYNVYITHSLTDFKEPKELDVKTLACYIKSSDSPDGRKLIVSYPIIAEILPILLHDMRATQTLERNSIMNAYALKFIDELYKAKKVRRGDENVAKINTEINLDDEYFCDLIENYDENKEKVLEALIFEVETRDTIYTDINTFIEDLFKKIIYNKEKDFILDGVDIFNEELSSGIPDEAWKKIKDVETFKKTKEDIVYKRIIERFKELLVNYNYPAHAGCLDNLVGKFGLDCVTNSLHQAIYGVYNSTDFDLIFDEDSDMGERD